MAGIGFELKKIFNNKGLFNNIRGYFYSTIVTIGPFILIMTMIVVIQLMLKFMNKPFHVRELFIISVVYAFIFSQVISSGFAMVITRYVSDKLYSKEYQDIIPSLYGIISLAFIIGSIFAIIFYWDSPLSMELKFATYILYMELIIMWLLMVYLSALKDYNKIIKSFLWGGLTTCILAYFIIKLEFISVILGLLFTMDIGVLIILVLLIMNIRKFFSSSSNKHFVMLAWFDCFPSIFFINLFYTIALYIHNLIIWYSPLGRHIAGTYVYAPIYDVPTFYAFLSIIPTITIFVVFVEINFYEKYKTYLFYITQKGSLTEINNAYKEMVDVLWGELTNLMELQLVFTFFSIVLGNYLLPKIGLGYASINIFNLLVLGAYLTGIMLIIIIILLYFEDRKGALIVAGIFMITNTVFTSMTLAIGPNTYGFGFFIASFISLLIGLIRTNYFIKRLDYYVFCSQPMFNIKQTGFLTKLTEKFYSK